MHVSQKRVCGLVVIAFTLALLLACATATRARASVAEDFSFSSLARLPVVNKLAAEGPMGAPALEKAFREGSGKVASVVKASVDGVAGSVKDGAERISTAIENSGKGWNVMDQMVFRAYLAVHATPPTDTAMKHYKSVVRQSGGRMNEAKLVEVMKKDLPEIPSDPFDY